ncbi:class I SAM-dependent DNA methyltransferase [Acinetobacter rathckeae]|uniref:class I SAM-dependent DNA methyltransferase n=1 Tax=Acinetobacter rathckeae TaxID=2605272 RepID=UPI0018A2E861|nr:class I SAM-dependent methyltransferase [Acinetobacter rathckeae]MBF7695212.1 class I SAM-dependent methyltransferase [Acinetobacter rathckeae]
MSDITNYYNQHAQEFFSHTYDVNMEQLYEPFLRYIQHNGLILDLGCGSGRDSLAFKNKGYHVDAIDFSEHLVEKATQFSGIVVRHQSFYDLNERSKYDAIWACASLLHCERTKLVDVFTRIITALKANGVCYASFKYGSTDREKDGRSFTDLNEQQAEQLLRQLPNTLLLQQWITIDKRPNRNEEWLNLIFRKIEQ